MARFGLVMAVLVTAAGQASASSWADSMFDELSRDFGSVPRGPTLSHPFRLVNTSKQTVHIADVRVSCSCTTARALQTTLGPGQETAILVQMDTRRFSNAPAVTVFAPFDQPRFEEVRLWVQANSRDDVVILPDSLAFGRIKRGTSPTASVTVSFLGNDQYQIEEVRSESNYVKPVCKLVRREAGEVTYQLSATIRGDAPPGNWLTAGRLKTNRAPMP